MLLLLNFENNSNPKPGLRPGMGSDASSCTLQTAFGSCIKNEVVCQFFLISSCYQICFRIAFQEKKQPWWANPQPTILNPALVLYTGRLADRMCKFGNPPNMVIQFSTWDSPIGSPKPFGSINCVLCFHDELWTHGMFILNYTRVYLHIKFI